MLKRHFSLVNMIFLTENSVFASKAKTLKNWNGRRRFFLQVCKSQHFFINCVDLHVLRSFKFSELSSRVGFRKEHLLAADRCPMFWLPHSIELLRGGFLKLYHPEAQNTFHRFL